MSFFSAIAPVLVLILGLFVSIQLWGKNSMMGPSQIFLLVAGLHAIFPHFYVEFKMGKHRKFSKTVLSAIWENIQNVKVAIWILCLVGALIGTWSISGILPGMILIGLKIIRPELFLLGACFASAIVSLASGSSWTTAGTVGVAMMGLGEVWNFPQGLVAGAILSGAYFGDKMSPLSDTTNLASGISKIPLSQHIRYMIPTTTFSIVCSFFLYAILGFFFDAPISTGIEMESKISQVFPLYLPSFLVPLAVLILVAMGLPAVPCLMLGVIGGVFLAWGVQEESWLDIGHTMVFGFNSQIGDLELDSLLSGGGILSMFPTIFLILSAMVFGACMEVSGKMGRIIHEIIKRIQNPCDLILSTMGFCIFTNLTTSDQYLSIVIPGKTMKPSYDRMMVNPRNLSRALEDSGTITSVLIPWNSCGAFMSTSLGVATLVYLPFCFFHWIHLTTAIWNVRKKFK
jgi:NhaC family Na+:H+ antiporter